MSLPLRMTASEPHGMFRACISVFIAVSNPPSPDPADPDIRHVRVAARAPRVPTSAGAAIPSPATPSSRPKSRRLTPACVKTPPMLVIFPEHPNQDHRDETGETAGEATDSPAVRELTSGSSRPNHLFILPAARRRASLFTSEVG